MGLTDIDFRGFASNFSYKKFLFVLNIETGGVFINSYNFWLSFASLFCSFFVTNFITFSINVFLYILAIFINIALMVLSIISLKGLENDSKGKFTLGFIPTVLWTVFFFSAILAQVTKYHYAFALQINIDDGYIWGINVLSQGDVVGVLVIFMLFHIYCLSFFLMLFMNKCANQLNAR